MTLNWKDRGDGRYDALASRKVGGKYFIRWVERYYSEQDCGWYEVRRYDVDYQPKGAGRGNIDQYPMRTLEKAKALAEFDHQKRKELVDRYGDDRNVPSEAWYQFSRERRAWQEARQESAETTPATPQEAPSSGHA